MKASALPALRDTFWVGALDPDLRVFDIVMRTENGTTYNSYLVKGTEKNVLFETVKESFFSEHLSRLREVIDPADIDYIVFNHTEPDHSGSLKALLELAPKATVLGSNTAINFLKEIVNQPFPGRAVTEKDEISLGDKTLRFFINPMLHWPDTMFTYIPETASLFTCDVFGCHYSDPRVFNDQIPGDFLPAYKYYFDNILGPYKRPHLTNALKKLEGLDIRFIGTGHGPALRENIPYYRALYDDWAAEKPHPVRVVICFVSAYGYTRALAKEIAEGLREKGVPEVQLFDLVTDSLSDAQAAAEEANGLLLGSPTMVGDALPPLYQLLVAFNPVIHRGKWAGAFGSYGWSGEAALNLTARMEKLNFKLPLPPLRVKLKPTPADLEQARQFGHSFAGFLQP